MDYASLISAAAQIASKYAASSAAGRATEAGLNNQQDSQRSNQYTTAQNAQMQAGNLDLQRKLAAEQARGGRSKQAMIGDMLANFQPTSIDVPGITRSTISGGLASSMGPMAKAAGAELSRQALLKLMEGDTYSGGDILPQPGVTAQPKAGTLEKIMAGIGTAGSMAGAVGSAMKSDDGNDSTRVITGGENSPTGWSNVQEIIKRMQAQNGGQ